MSDAKRLADLVEQYLRGGLDPAGREELHGLLRQDDSSRAFFAEQLALSNLLSEMYQAKDFTIETVDRVLAGDAATKEDSKQVSTRHLRRLRRIRQHESASSVWLVPALIAAGVLIGITLLIFTAATSPETPPVHTAEIPVKQTPAPPTPVRPVEPPTTEPAPETSPEPLPRPPIRTEAVRKAEAEIAKIRKESPRQDSPATRKPTPPAPKNPTVAAIPARIATLEVLSGTPVVLRADGSRDPQGRDLREGDGVDTLDGTAAVVFLDDTRVGLEANTRIRHLSADAAAKRAGKWVTIEAGSLSADVAKQPLTRPMKFGSRHGVATVLGTSLTLRLQKSGMRLEVTEGRVRLRRGTNGPQVTVTSGYFAVAGAGVRLVSAPLDGERLFADDFSNAPVGAWPRGWREHSGTGRSGFRVVAEAGNRYIACPAPPAGSTQHAFIPHDAWGADFDVSFRMRLSGPSSRRAGIELEDGAQIPAFEYDHRAGLLRASWPRTSPNKTERTAVLKLEEARWHDWNVRVRGRSVTIRVGGVELTADIPGLGTITRSSLISTGADPVHYDDVRVLRPRSK